MDLRRIVGKRPLLQCAASVIIINEEGELLLGKRTDNQKWGYSGGSMNLGESVVYSMSLAIGFGVAIILFAGMREQLELSNVPKALKGTPIALITAGLLALAFMGFQGLV